MKINNINNINFNGKIIDSHVHSGFWYDKKYTLEDLDTFSKAPLSNGDIVEKMLISSLDSMQKDGSLNEVQGLEKILKETSNNPKYGVLAVCQPNLTNGDTREISQIIEQNRDRIFGLKFHPKVLNAPITKNSQVDENYVNYLKMAQEKKLPCLFHTEKGNITSATQVYELAKKAPNASVILGHCGGYDGIDEAIEVIKKSIKNNDAKLYCDISWLDWKNDLPDGAHKSVKKLIEQLKKINALDRILFGTDAPLGCFGEKQVGNIGHKEAYEKTVIGLKNMIKTEFGQEADEIIEKIFYKNANKLFFSRKAIKGKKAPILIAFAGIVGFLGILGGVYIKNHTQKITKKQNNEISLINKNDIPSTFKAFM